MNLLMLVELGGRERTLEEYRELLERSGYRLERTIPAPAPPYPWTVIEATRSEL